LQIRYWLTSEPDLAGALVVINTNPESQIPRNLQSKLEAKLKDINRAVSVVAWQPSDSGQLLGEALEGLSA
jgi:hypothetical protein